MGSTTSTTSPGTPFGDWAPTSISTSALALLGVMVTLVLGFSLTVLLPVVLPLLSSPDVFLSAPVPAWAAASAAGAACTVFGVMVSVCPAASVAGAASSTCAAGVLSSVWWTSRGGCFCSLPSRLCFLGLCYRSCCSVCRERDRSRQDHGCNCQRQSFFPDAILHITFPPDITDSSVRMMPSCM